MKPIHLTSTVWTENERKNILHVVHLVSAESVTSVVFFAGPEIFVVSEVQEKQMAIGD